MLTSVLTNLITGFFGVGKTTAIRSILGRKPPHEKWTLVNRSDDEMGKATIAYRRDSRVEIIAKKKRRCQIGMLWGRASLPVCNFVV